MNEAAHKTEIVNIPPLKEVKSSNVHAVGHDTASNTLYVQFKGPGGMPGSVYRYQGVTADTHKGLLASHSVGKYINQHIKGKFQGQKI